MNCTWGTRTHVYSCHTLTPAITMATAPETHPVGPCPSDSGNTSLSNTTSDTHGMADSPSTRQLDFYQAMRDFKLMFPNMDEDVIEAVLRANNGAVDDTIDQLLTMNVDGDGVLVSAEGRAGQLDGRAGSPIYMNQDLIKVPTSQRGTSSGSSSEVGSPPQYDSSVGRFDPPSYNDCLSNSAKPSPSHSATPPKSSATDLLAELGGAGHLESGLTLDTLEGAIGGYIPKKQKQEQTSEKTLLKQAMAIDDDFTPAVPPMMSLLNHDYTGKKAPGASPARSKRRYRDWNPPMLGTLPDDFLRFTITPPSTPERHRSHSHHSTPEHQLHQLTPQHLHHVPHHQVTPPAILQHHTPHRVKAMSPQRSASTQHAHTLHYHHSGRKEKSAKGSTGTPTVGRSQSLRKDPGTITVMSSRKHPNLRTVTATHGSEEISSNLIQRKIAENERARTCSAETMTPERAQVLEDERLALLSQNGEFLQVLMRDADFMKTLERDHMNATAFETPPIEPSTVSAPDQAEGYGSDNQAELGAFPFSQALPKDKDDNAEFQRQLTHMGGLSKKKFSALAKKFFTRKKKQKKVLKDSVAPSTANLLEDDDTDDEFRDAVHPERSVGYDQ